MFAGGRGGLFRHRGRRRRLGAFRRQRHAAKTIDSCMLELIFEMRHSAMASGECNRTIKPFLLSFISFDLILLSFFFVVQLSLFAGFCCRCCCAWLRSFFIFFPFCVLLTLSAIQEIKKNVGIGRRGARGRRRRRLENGRVFLRSLVMSQRVVLYLLACR